MENIQYTPINLPLPLARAVRIVPPGSSESTTAKLELTQHTQRALRAVSALRGAQS